MFQLLLLLLLQLPTAQALYFEDGYDHHYTYSSESDILGMHNVTTVIKFRVRHVNTSLHMLMMDSIVQHSEHGYVVDNALGWKLDNKFFFAVGKDGIVTFVHFHPEEINEVLMLKKVLASILSTKLQVDSDDSYVSEEEDHTGVLEHEYTIKRHKTGIRVTKGHKSLKEVHRSHNKTVHFDMKGTPLYVNSLDNVTLRDESTPVSSKTVQGAAEIPDSTTGELPTIGSVSRTRLRLTTKTQHHDNRAHSLSEMKRDSLTVRGTASGNLEAGLENSLKFSFHYKKPVIKKSLTSIEADIDKTLQCIHSTSNKFDVNRTECVHELRTRLSSLEHDDFISLGKRVFGKRCRENDTICVDERNLFIDIVGSEGSSNAQLVILNDVMLQPNATENDVGRCLFHCVALTNPVMELVEHVEHLCFADIPNAGDTPTLSRNRRRACLSLGAMAKSLHETNATVSDRIVEKIETWLGHHDEVKSAKIAKPRRRRAIHQQSHKARKHIETKMVLLQSLGNAGKQRSLEHIKSYMTPNAGFMSWRMAAIHSLRHFKCNESTHHLVISAVHDDNEIVRKTAVTVLKQRSSNKPDMFTAEHESVVLSKNYSYPVVARVRRGLMDDLIEGISLYIKPPGIEWDKVLGNKKVGASFGLHIRNILDLKLGLLDGHFKVDVHDGAYAEIHIGYIGFKMEIFKALICFNGHIEYNLNVLKDFDIDEIFDLAHLYDKILGKTINPIMTSVTKFQDIVAPPNRFKRDTNGNRHGLIAKIEYFISTVKNLPIILGHVSSQLEKFVVEIFSIAGSSVIEEIKELVQQLRQFVDGVKTDILKFYNDVVDAVTMALPYIGKKIIECYNLIVEGMRALFKSPTHGSTAMSRAIKDLKMSTTMMLDVKKTVVDACLFIKGRTTQWLNTAKEIPAVLKRLSGALNRLQVQRRTRRFDTEDKTNTLGNGLESTETGLNRFKEKLQASWNNVFDPIRHLTNLAQPFIDEFKSITDAVQAIKYGYTSLKESIENSKKLIQKVFGPKFHKSFPTYRRPARNGCKAGLWGTTTEGHYKTTGVDLLLGVGQKITNPVNGIVHKNGDQRVVVIPTDPEFEEFEIVIENINHDISDGKYYKAGEKIGKAGRAPRCTPNFIHVSVRKAMKSGQADEAYDYTGEPTDEDYDYTDLSPHLDRLIPIPKWIQDCNTHEFRFVGQTTDSGESTDLPKELKDQLSRKPDPDTTNVDDMMGTEDSKYRPDDPDLSDKTPFGKSLMDSLKDQAKKFASSFQTTLFGSDGPKVPNILDIVDMREKTVMWMLDSLQDGELKKEMTGIIEGLTHKITAPPIGNPFTFGLTYMNHLLEANGVPPTIGDVSKLTDTLMNNAEKKCPQFRGALAQGVGHICTVCKDCLGLICSVSLHKAGKTGYVKITTVPNLAGGSVQFTVNDNAVQLIYATDADIEFNTNVSVLDMDLYMTAALDFYQGIMTLSLEVKLCEPLFHICLSSIEVFHMIPFKGLAPTDAHNPCDIENDATRNKLHGLSVPNFIHHLGDYQLLEKSTIGVIEKVRSTVVNQLLNDRADTLGNPDSEFQDKVDFCLSANIPVPVFDIPILPEALAQPYLFMIGPIPFSFRFRANGAIGLGVKVGICLLSMTTKLSVTPWLGAKVIGDLAVDLGFARGGLRLVGYLMETKFPITVELVFSKHPIDVGSRMDLILTPVRLILKAFVELDLKVKIIKLYDGAFWTYKCKSIEYNIFDKKKKKDDMSPPDIMPATVNERTKREGVRGCIVKQVPNRPFYSPAFTLEMHAQDEVSEVKLFYAIGTHRGGTNVVDWTEMGGSSLLAPGLLPGGIPLYWTVKARNSQGLEAIQQCFLKTFDSTLPDGRVEHAYKFSSHPTKLKATVIVFEDSPLIDTHYKAVGLSPGQFGSQVVDWEPLRLDETTARDDVLGHLKYFSVPRKGKLVANILRSQEVRTADICAKTCMEYGHNCVSFSYEYHSETCALHDAVEGANAYLRISGTYSNYERLGSGYNAPLEYNHLSLAQGTMYYINTMVSNVLGYDAFLIGEGTMVDFSPPEPGLLQNPTKDILRADNCTAAVTQLCIDVTWKENHRIIIDGEGSGTVFNGHKPTLDELYTLTNHYVTANWKGFHDDESGIWGYTWAVGTKVCGNDVISFEDPYSHLTSKRFWTDSAFHKGVHLSDGEYYVTVQALNSAELGGSLVTTVCHSTPFMVDTSPPVFNKVTDIIYDEDFDLIAIYYDAEDSLSKIAKAEFGLGKTKYDVQLKPYSLHAAMDRADPFVAVEDLGLEDGVPAWLRIRVTNNVGLFATGHSDEPILIDKSPPIPGTVMDGNKLRQDIQYQSDNKHICAQWINFYDRESGIDRFLWGVGTAPKLDDVIEFHNLTHYDKSSCAPVSLEHNRTYYSTVFAFNTALNSKDVNASSDGVLVDITEPLPGEVFDGRRGEEELKFSSETVSKYTNWRGYHDPESGIADYKVEVIVNGEHKKTFDVDTKTEFEDHTLSMEHKDCVQFTVNGINGAELEVSATSDGFFVDHTPPIMTSISDNRYGSTYQSDNNHMYLSWDFYDDESYIREYRTKIYKTKHGVKRQFWPDQPKHYNVTKPLSVTNGKMAVMLENLAMEDGAIFTLHVTALNGGMLATSHETAGVTVDTTPPQEPKIKVGLPKEDEETDELDRVLHNDQNAIRLSWSGRDAESGIEQFFVAIGTDKDPESIHPFTDYGFETTAYIQHIQLKSSSASGFTYVASIKAVNGAGLISTTGKSKHIYIQKANVPGVVFDGRENFEDYKYTIDRVSIAASFYGFESESCDIVEYEWAVGTTEFGSDVLSYTTYGVVMLNDTHGQTEEHIELFESTTYYVTIRAVTGCMDEFILSTSDGITLDTTPPKVVYQVETSNDTNTVVAHDTLFQDTIDTLELGAKVTDEYSISSTSWALGSLPLLDDRHAFTPDFRELTRIVSQQPGEAIFITADTVDQAGNRFVSSSMAVISDNTAPMITHLECTDFLSYHKTLLTCSWETLVEYESLIDKITVTITTNEKSTILAGYVVPRESNCYSLDLYHELNARRNITRIFATFFISNVVGHQKTYGREITVDISPPNFDKLEVVTSSTTIPSNSHQKCQLPRAFVELRAHGVKDFESDIDLKRYEASLGLKPYGTEIKNYVPVTQRGDGTFFLDEFTLNVGAVFYATLRVYNKAGLYFDVTSDSVVVSQAPYLTVIDGNKEDDIDYQQFINVIQGRWEYSDSCPIREAKWRVEYLTGMILFDFMTIISAGKQFYNDEVALENGMKYIVTVQTIDFLNRTQIAHSNGVTVRIQPPFPGHVRDGVEDDINYQYSNTELSANWDPFGDGSNDPTQTIHHYEISIGNDRRYEKTRSNVHFFVNVGLNTSHTFKHLNLTEKLVRYYISVRSYSIAGGYGEGYSNGIRVGYRNDIGRGVVTLNPFQYDTDAIAATWTGFQADIDILMYKIGVSSQIPDFSNDTIECRLFGQNTSVYDISDLHEVGLNEYVKISNISLKHGNKYFVSIIAEDEAGMCTAVTSNPVMVDTTPPYSGSLFINNVKSGVISFATSDSEIQVRWENFQDTESGIQEAKVSLLECMSCHPSVSLEACVTVAENIVHSDNKAAFYDIELYPAKSYIVKLDIINGAYIHTVMTSATILIDFTSPLPGEVKISENWNTINSFHHSTRNIRGLLAIAANEDEYVCKSQIHIFPTNPPIRWKQFQLNFTNEFMVINRTGAYLGVGYSSDLSTILKSGIVSHSQNLKKGNYSFAIRAAPGNKIVTSVAFISDVISVPFTIHDKPKETFFDYSEFENITGLHGSNYNETETSNMTTELPFSTSIAGDTFAMSNKTKTDSKPVLNKNAYGFGIHFLGYKIGNNTNWYHVFWVRNRFTNKQIWFSQSSDPTKATYKYIVNIKQKRTFTDNVVDVTLFRDDDEILTTSGFAFNSDMELTFLTWNEDGYNPPIESVFQPFYSEAIVSSIAIPDETDKPCLHGKGFFDGESGIKEIQVGVSDSATEIANIRPFTTYRLFCFPCIKPCDDICKQPCNDTHLKDGFNIIPIEITGLDLEPTRINSSCLNASSESNCNSTAYFLSVKLVNFAGKETVVYSNAIQIDVTPPECEYVRCLDPDYDKDAPTTYLGSNSSVGAYWEFKEDVSSVEYYIVSILSDDHSITLMNDTNVGSKTKITVHLGEGAFQHNHVYEVQVTATNTAGLRMTSFCSVRVILHPPSVEKASFLPLYTEGGTSATGGVTEDSAPCWTSAQDRIGLTWDASDNNTDFFEWKIGSTCDQQDIFPAVKIGQKGSGSVAIENGVLKLDKSVTNTTMMDLRDRQNMTAEQIQDLAAASDRRKAFFYMEPGRCMHQSLYAIGFSHLRTKMKGRTVCIKRPSDVSVDASGGGHVVVTKEKSSDTWRNEVVLSSSEIALEAKLTSGSMSMGTLSKEDKASDYGSAATADFMSYIVDPGVTGSRTTRMLRNRIQRFCNLTFFVAPSPSVDFEYVKINMTVTSSCDKDIDYQPALIYWDIEKQSWTHTDEGCYDSPTSFMDVSAGIYMAEVCNKARNDSRQRRQTVTSMSSPRHFELARIKRAFPNSPPSIDSETLETEEDNVQQLLVETSDPDNDDLIFQLLVQAENAECTIGIKTGILDCVLDEDFYGENSISVRITETGLPATEQPMVVEKNITLNIKGAPDKTERFFLDRYGRIHREVKPFLYHTLTVEANGTDTVFAGTIILADKDGEEVFTEKIEFTALGNATFTIEEVDLKDVRKQIFSRHRTIQAYSVRFKFSPEINGNMTLKFIAQTATGEYTPSVTIHVYVLEHPCVYGECSHSSLGKFACDSIDRAKTFDGYMCMCSPGYKGTWCEIEINECEQDPCSTLFDCGDLVNAYECNINVGKLMSILICCMLAMAGIGFLVYNLKKRYDENKLRQSQVTLTGGVPYEVGPGSRSLTPILGDKSTTPPVNAPPVFTNTTYLGEEVDLSVISGLTVAAGKKLPPHHPRFRLRPGNASLDPDTFKGYKPGRNTSSVPDTSDMSLTLDQASESLAMYLADSHVTAAHDTAGGNVGPSPRCPSAASQKTVSTIDGNQIRLGGNLVDIDV